RRRAIDQACLCSDRSSFASAILRPPARQLRRAKQRSTGKFARVSSSTFLALRRSKPARDFKFAMHHCRIATIDGKIDVFKHDEGLRLLNVVKKIDERWPRTFRFD